MKWRKRRDEPFSTKKIIFAWFPRHVGWGEYVWLESVYCIRHYHKKWSFAYRTEYFHPPQEIKSED
jgi:hypothetical protein